jgi:hypothetical protein
MQFELLKTDGAARRGMLTLAHGIVQTPVFMPVGTYGTVKAMTPQALNDIGAQIWPPRAILVSLFLVPARPLPLPCPARPVERARPFGGTGRGFPTNPLL